MIKNSTYIRDFTKNQRKQLEKVQQAENLKTVPEILFFALEKYLEQKAEIDRLNRIILYKQAKINRLDEEMEFFENNAAAVHALSEKLKEKTNKKN